MKAWLKAFQYQGRHRGKYKFHNGGIIVGPVRAWTLPEVNALCHGFSHLNGVVTMRVPNPLTDNSRWTLRGA